MLGLYHPLSPPPCHSFSTPQTTCQLSIMKLTLVLATFAAIALASPAPEVPALKPCVCKTPICPLELIAVRRLQGFEIGVKD